jgi:hypothetical protein
MPDAAWAILSIPGLIAVFAHEIQFLATQFSSYYASYCAAQQEKLCIAVFVFGERNAASGHDLVRRLRDRKFAVRPLTRNGVRHLLNHAVSSNLTRSAIIILQIALGRDFAARKPAEFATL